MAFAYADLLCFEAVVDHGHVGRAAAALQVGQPAVSKTLQRIEKAVGMPLFERGAHGVVLTASGHLFRDQVRPLIAQHEAALRAARDIRAQHSGLLRLGLTQATSEGTAPRAVADLLRHRPGLRIQLEIGKSDDLERALHQGMLDLAVVPAYPGQAGAGSLRAGQAGAGSTRSGHGVASPTPSVQAVADEPAVVGGDRLVVAARPTHPLFAAHRRRPDGLGFNDLMPYGWTLPSRASAARTHVDRQYAAQGLAAPTVVLEIEHNTEAALTIVAQTDLLCFVPDLFLRRMAGRLKRLPFTALDTPREWVLISRPRAVWTPLMHALRDKLRDQTV
ncbi:LysR family transcriptional regulator [Pigmentiphaga litoralis]|uniref:LysR family transcriptional regulator n=1 Tax=Pigmentiphaga litoralis TaxID=516702 RepID=UPI001672D049|nr:LysR family transcriptional regulator [Pigmentiphaga litoralis]GGX01701.1 LysR family transcriptional regulator [Pigmentiphaga litoralis]